MTPLKVASVSVIRQVPFIVNAFFFFQIEDVFQCAVFSPFLPFSFSMKLIDEPNGPYKSTVADFYGLNPT